MAANHWGRTTLDTTGPHRQRIFWKSISVSTNNLNALGIRRQPQRPPRQDLPDNVTLTRMRHTISWIHIPSRGCSLPLLVSLHPCRDPEPTGTNNRNLHWPLECIPLGHRASRNHGSSIRVWHHRFFDHTTESCDEGIFWRSIGASIVHLSALGIQLKPHNPPSVPGASQQQYPTATFSSPVHRRMNASGFLLRPLHCANLAAVTCPGASKSIHRKATIYHISIPLQISELASPVLSRPLRPNRSPLPTLRALRPLYRHPRQVQTGAAYTHPRTGAKANRYQLSARQQLLLARPLLPLYTLLNLFVAFVVPQEKSESRP